jgi:hypothetical protein
MSHFTLITSFLIFHLFAQNLSAGSPQNNCGGSFVASKAATEGEMPDARQVLKSFLERHNSLRGTIAANTVSPRDLMPETVPVPELTPFSALHDTFLFSKLVGEMLALTSPRHIRTLYDLGAGSSVPSLRALVEHPQFETSIIAVEFDPHAIRVSERNAVTYGQRLRYSFQEIDMLEFLRQTEVPADAAIIANPPYLPVPKDLRDPLFLPVDGGMDGTKYLAEILTHPMPSGTLLALEWCSLSNPVKLIELIESGYEVVYVQAYDIPFGLYTEDPALKPHLLYNGENNLSVFSINEIGKLSWTFIGTVLRRK